MTTRKKHVATPDSPPAEPVAGDVVAVPPAGEVVQTAPAPAVEATEPPAVDVVGSSTSGDAAKTPPAEPVADESSALADSAPAEVTPEPPAGDVAGQDPAAAADGHAEPAAAAAAPQPLPVTVLDVAALLNGYADAVAQIDRITPAAGPDLETDALVDEPRARVDHVVVDADCTVNFRGAVLVLAKGQLVDDELADFLATTGAPVSIPAPPEA